MVKEIIGFAGQSQFLRIELSVSVTNKKAIQLYEKVGFNEMAIRRNYYPAFEGREDAVLMGLAL